MDVFGIGVLLYQVLGYNQPAFPAFTSSLATAGFVATGNVCRINPGCIPSCLWELMEQCWHQDPERRIDLGELLMRLRVLRDDAVREVKDAKKRSRQSQQY